MSAYLIDYVLGQDYKRNRTAAQVRALLPTQWATDADVPHFLYQPLSWILLGLEGDAAAQAALQEIIIPSYGLGNTPDEPNDQSIQLISLPFESVAKADGMKSDATGAETALLKTMVQIGADLDANDAFIASQADLRIRLIIDKNCRSLAMKNGEIWPKGNGLPVTGDPTINKNYPAICNYLGFIDNETAIGKVSLYLLQYTRTFV